MRRREEDALARQATLVTGAHGFVGTWLLRHLSERGEETVGIGREAPQPELRLDLLDRPRVEALLAELRPTRIVHLAGYAEPARALAEGWQAVRDNALAVSALLDAAARACPGTRVLHVSSGEVYGPAPADAKPHREDDPPRPRGFYAATKRAGELRALRAARAHGLELIVARPFNHTGPGRPARYAEAAFARQLARIEAGQQEAVLRVGNLEAVRDFSDVRDVVAAYALLLERAEPGGVYNVCSGQGRSVRALLDRLIAQSSVAPRVERDPARFRALAPRARALVGDPSRLRALGWQPRYDFDETLRDVLDDWRARA